MTQILPSQTESTEAYESLSMYRTLDDSNPAVSDRTYRIAYVSLSMYRTLDDSNHAVSDRKHRNVCVYVYV